MIHNIALTLSGLATGYLAGVVLIQTEPPADLVTFQWIAISILAGAVGTLFWQYTKTRDNNLIKMTEILTTYHAAMTANTDALRELTRTVADIASINKLDQRLANLESRIEKRPGGRREG